MKTSDATFIYPRIMKILGFLIILFSITGMIFQYLKAGMIDLKTPFQLLSLGLLFVFFSRERIDDERIHQFKFRSLTAGFLAAYLLMFSFNYFSYELAVHEFVTIVLIFSTAAFYYAKFRL